MPGKNIYYRSRHRLVASFGGIILAMIALLGFDLVENRRQAFETARILSDTMSRLLSERIEASVREADHVLIDLIDSFAESSQSKAKLRRLVEARGATLPPASSLALLDGEGSVLASSGSADLEAERACARSFAANPALKETTLAVFGAAAGGGALLRARAIRGGTGLVLAAARIDLGIIQNEIADLELGDRWIVVVADSELKLVARRPAAPSAVGAEVSDPATRDILRALKDAGPGSLSMRSEKGPLYYCARVGEYPFYVAVGEERPEVMAGWERRFAIYGLALCSMIFLMVLLARLLDKNFVRSAELAARLVAMESASDMIVIADLEGKAEYVNPSFERSTGLSKNEVLGSRRAIFGLAQEEAEAALKAAAEGRGWRGEIDTQRADGESIVEEATIAPVPGPDGKPVRLVAVLRDVTERRRLQERLERLAHYDPLTTLPNRALFFDRLEGAVARAHREERRFALLFIDLDGFKAVNDGFGHDAGDWLLFELARRLKTAVRDSDAVGRMGGDEFTVLLENISRPEDASAVAEKVRFALTEPAVIPAGATVKVGASIGIAVFPEDGADGEAILKAADSAMYAKKLAAGDRR